MTPKEVVDELDRYIVGQKAAKRAVAIALRNRHRRQQVAAELRDEIAPKNIIMIGPTGVGKTEIARRLAKLANAPFIKVEASKYTEVGYVGRDVESMIRDLVEIGVQMVRGEEKKRVEERAAELAEERLLDILVPPAPTVGFEQGAPQSSETREKFRAMLKAGSLDDKNVDIDFDAHPTLPVMQVFSNAGMDDMGSQIQDMFSQLGAMGGGNGKRKKRSVKVKDAKDLLAQQEASRLIDMEKVSREAVKRTEEAGIVFIDEIDKVARSEGGGRGPDVSREGVQRDLLPLVEGSTVNTKYGIVRTDHILFVAAGAFHVSKVSDLIPELQGRFPIRVELEALTESDFVRILTEPKNSLVRQYTALLATEQVTLDFTEDGVRELCRVAAVANNRSENIGARRLHTVMEKMLEDISFDAPEKTGSTVKIDAGYVSEKLQRVLQDEDLSKYIL